MNWYLEVLKKYAQFDGRARRKEYWFFALVNFIISFVLGLAGGSAIAIGARTDSSVYAPLGIGLIGLYMLAVFLPSLAVSVRRLHDTGKSGWMLLLGLIPLVGGLIILVFTLQDSQPGPNMYGPNPKGIDGALMWNQAVPRI